MKFFNLLVILFLQTTLYAQNAPFSVYIEPVDIPNLGGLQSYAFGQANGKWLIVGGRLDGLHRRQPWASFDVAGHNNQLIVIDPITEEVWTHPLADLSTDLEEQLSATNMEFYQEGNYLYCLGGYGYSATIGDHTTYPFLSAIDVPATIDAVINGNNVAAYFRQITDTTFQVTGGRLRKIEDRYYLLGGQKFLGRYNPMGPGHGPGFIQEYTDAIRIFELTDDGTTIQVQHINTWTDADHLHRRDYNAEAQIMPNGEEGITMFSGVFQQTVDLPFLNCVNVDSSGFVVNNSFQQYYNHYHCPALPIYDANSQEMHTIFFGGIAQYYEDNTGTLIQDNDVPFVKTIARVTRDANGIMTEYKLPIEMPSLLGAGAEFIPNLATPHYGNEVFDLSQITGDTTLMGYIYGGIHSSDLNIFWINDGTQSEATPQIFKVYIVQDNTTAIDIVNSHSNSELKFRAYPNPAIEELTLEFSLEETDDVTVSIWTASGALMQEITFRDVPAGQHSELINFETNVTENIYLLEIRTSKQRLTQKILVNE